MSDEAGGGSEEKRRMILHPFLLALLPLLSLYSYNAGRVSPVLIWRPAVALLAAALFCLLVLRPFMRDWHRAGVGAALVVFASTAGWGVLEERLIEPLQSARIVAPVYALLLLGLLIFVARTKRDVSRLTAPLNLFSVILTGLFIVNAAFYTYTAECPEPPDPPEWAHDPAAETTPNIYFLALEGYPRADVLRERPLAINNRPFLHAMEDLGFETSAGSAVNYPFVLENYAAALDMDFVHDGEDISSRREDLLCILGHSLSGRICEAVGYERIMIAGGAHSPLPRQGAGDVRRPFMGLNVLETVLLERTFIARSMNMYSKYTSGRWESWRRFNDYLHADFAFEELARLAAEGNRPFFAVAHVSAPRGPAIFSRQGAFQEGDPDETPVQAMQRQFAGVNARLKKMAASIVEADPKAVVIIMSLDGLEPALARDLATPQETARCLANLAMFRFPKGMKGEAGIYAGITPVNSLRTAMRVLLKADVPFAKDRMFCVQGEDSPHYEEVTTP